MTLSFPTVNCLQMPAGGAGSLPSVLRPLEDVFAGVADAGFTHIGIDHFSVQDHLERGAPGAEVRELLDRFGLVCSEIGVLRIGEPTSSVAAAQRLAELAAECGATICTTAMDEEPGPAVVDTLRRCADVLAPHRVRMALEFVPYSSLATLRSAQEVCDAVGWDRCGLLVDSWMFFRGDNMLAELEELRSEEIGYIQFDDAPDPVGADLIYESRHRRVVPGEGTLDLRSFTATVLRGGFDGVVSVEVLSEDFRTLEPVEQARRALGAARGFWP